MNISKLLKGKKVRGNVVAWLKKTKPPPREPLPKLVPQAVAGSGMSSKVKRASMASFADEYAKIAGSVGSGIGAGVLGSGVGAISGLREWERRKREGSDPSLSLEDRAHRNAKRAKRIGLDSAVGAVGGGAVGHFVEKGVDATGRNLQDKITKGVDDGVTNAVTRVAAKAKRSARSSAVGKSWRIGNLPMKKLRLLHRLRK